MAFAPGTVCCEMPEPYANSLEYAAQELSMDVGQILVWLIQIACTAETQGELSPLGKPLYNWLTAVEQVPPSELWPDWPTEEEAQSPG